IVFHSGRTGESYNVSSGSLMSNIELVKNICKILDKKIGDKKREKLIQFVTDRPGHDRRYSLDSSKIRKELGWKPSHDFETALKSTVNWYLQNETWLKNCTSGEYLKYYETM
ncbi:MAG TPA: GDP-mannose 4,6-dehydratase, partial [candidate division Zixibacteria bacterium]|nr:GDP-mannose 4,6-dehydratase [candidate division Zixibacteria bacterium]